MKLTMKGMYMDWRDDKEPSKNIKWKRIYEKVSPIFDTKWDKI